MRRARWWRPFGPTRTSQGMRANSGGAVWSGTQTASEAHDLTVTFDAAGLTSGQTYQYQFCTPSGDHSAVGTFKTAPTANQRADINFAYTGDFTARDAPGSNSTTPFYDSFDVFRLNGERPARLRRPRRRRHLLRQRRRRPEESPLR